jgi:hypothetical protein
LRRADILVGAGCPHWSVLDAQTGSCQRHSCGSGITLSRDLATCIGLVLWQLRVCLRDAGRALRLFTLGLPFGLLPLLCRAGVSKLGRRRSAQASATLVDKLFSIYARCSADCPHHWSIAWQGRRQCPARGLFWANWQACGELNSLCRVGGCHHFCLARSGLHSTSWMVLLSLLYDEILSCWCPRWALTGDCVFSFFGSTMQSGHYSPTAKRALRGCSWTELLSERIGGGLPKC